MLTTLMPTLPWMQRQMGDPPLPRRPRTRSLCLKQPRPCLFITCRYHLIWEQLPSHLGRRGSLRRLTDEHILAHLEQMKHTCVLDEITPGGTTLEEVGILYGVTRERIRQIESKGMRRARIRSRQLGLDKQLDFKRLPTRFFTDVVLEYRNLHHWTKRDLARETRIPFVHLNRILCGTETASRAQLNLIAHALKVELDELVRGTEYEEGRR